MRHVIYTAKEQYERRIMIHGQYYTLGAAKELVEELQSVIHEEDQ